MDYRRNSLVLNRQNHATTNSHIYASFAGTGVAARPTDGILSDVPRTMWWDDDRIEGTVTRQYVINQLRPDEADRLDEPLRFGHGLTDDTYWEWIELKAKRIFLILVELGVPDQIFGVIDDSWDDDDLPIPMDQVERLALTYEKDEKLEKKFFQKQFNYLLRHIQKGEQIAYDDEEIVPLELVDKRPVNAVPGLAPASDSDRVHLPGKPDDIFLRRKIPLGMTPGKMPPEEYLSGIGIMRAVEHTHLTSLWASYVYENCGYLLLTPVNDTTLKSVLTITPQSIKILAKQDRRILLLNWIHCLAEALAFLHKQGLAHKNIKPSTVMLNSDNHIFLGDLGLFQTGVKEGFDKANYDYAAPEDVPRPVTSAPGMTSSRASNSGDSASVRTSPTGPPQSPVSPRLRTNGLARRNDPQKSDIFSLGTIFLEILTFLLKRSSKNFANHRSAKNKTPGRGGGLPDASFHKNQAQVESWMDMLAKDASKKEDKIYRGVSHIVSLVGQMINPIPSERPTAAYVQERIYTVLNDYCGIGADAVFLNSHIHCESRKVREAEYNFGFQEMRLASQRAAAEACAAVAAMPYDPDPKPMGLGDGSVIYGIEREDSITEASQVVAECDENSIITRSSRSSEGKSKDSGGNRKLSQVKAKPKAKPWQAPVYAGLYLSAVPTEL
ncbi:kinase-like domain-containing protein [Bisporella sp. PMI_857]|nr:kinase-like domain-containing protein [Bisporella sp. PMI_857]